MSDIRNQLIKDSYDYVLQSDLGTGVVYRIGGTIPVNPIFQSGLTVTGGFTYSGAGEQFGYALLTDGTGYAFWGPISAATPASGVTSITVGNGLSANTSTGAVTIIFTGSTSISGLTYYVSATTPTGGSFISGDRWFNTITGDELVYINDGDSQQWIQICCGSGGGGGGGSSSIQGITGITGTSGVSASTTDYGTIIINTDPDKTVVITGGTGIQIVSDYPNFGINYTGATGITGDYLPLSGGTVSGGTIFQSGLTANTISATTYYNLPGTSSSNCLTTLYVTNISGCSPVNLLSVVNLTDKLNVTGNSIFQSGLTANTISASTYQNLPITGVTSGTGISISSNGVGGFQITNTSPNQTVTITGGTNIQIAGTYPNFGVNFTGTTGSNFTGGTVTGPTNFTNGLTANTISAATYQNLPSSFQSVRINNTTQFSANTGNFINFSGVNLTIISGANNTLIFSAGTGGGGGGSIAIYDETDLLTSNVSSITFEGAGVTASNTGNDVTVTIPGGGSGGGTTLIASSSCNITPNGTIYIGNSTYGWNHTNWDFDFSSYNDPYSNCLIPIPKDILKSDRITICGNAYIDDSNPESCTFNVYLYQSSCEGGGISKPALLSGSNNYSYTSKNIVCFSLVYIIPNNPGLVSCTDFIVVGFSSNSIDASVSKITYTLNTA